MLFWGRCPSLPTEWYHWLSPPPHQTSPWQLFAAASFQFLFFESWDRCSLATDACRMKAWTHLLAPINHCPCATASRSVRPSCREPSFENPAWQPLAQTGGVVIINAWCPHSIRPSIHPSNYSTLLMDVVFGGEAAVSWENTDANSPQESAWPPGDSNPEPRSSQWELKSCLLPGVLSNLDIRQL